MRSSECPGRAICRRGRHGHKPAGPAKSFDLLIERSRENQGKVRAALEILPDKAMREMTENDLDEYGVVRVADEIVVDLMMSACGITYEEARSEIEVVMIAGVPIPSVSARLLLRMKQTYRDKHIPDRIFLE